MNRPDLQVLNVQVQYFMKNLLRRSVCLDILATDLDGKLYNIEIQRADKGAGAKRARYNSSMIDAKVMEKGSGFEQLPESYVIFVTEHDVLGMGKPLYHIERTVMENGTTFGDDAHIMYVNGQYQGDDALGHLMRDFHCTEPSRMYYNVLKERVSYFKETKEGVAIMCKAIEDMRNQEREEGRLEGKTETMISLVKDGLLALSEAAKRLQITENECQSLVEKYH